MNYRLSTKLGPDGLEPSTPVLSGLCSNQLSYGPVYKNKIFRKAKNFRKEVIQPHLPVRLPCYDLAPVTRFTFILLKAELQVPPAPIA